MNKTTKKPTMAKKRTSGANLKKVGTSAKKRTSTSAVVKKQDVNPFLQADFVRKNPKSYTLQKVTIGSKGLQVKSTNLKSTKATDKQFKEFKDKCVKPVRKVKSKS